MPLGRWPHPHMCTWVLLYLELSRGATCLNRALPLLDPTWATRSSLRLDFLRPSCKSSSYPALVLSSEEEAPLSWPRSSSTYPILLKDLTMPRRTQTKSISTLYPSSKLASKEWLCRLGHSILWLSLSHPTPFSRLPLHNATLLCCRTFLVFLDLVSVLALPSIINSAWIGLLPPDRLENFS